MTNASPGSDYHNMLKRLSDWQLASASTAAAVYHEWAGDALSYARDVRRIVGGASQGGPTRPSVGTELADAYSQWLRRSVRLPAVAGLRFFVELNDLRR